MRRIILTAIAATAVAACPPLSAFAATPAYTITTPFPAYADNALGLALGPDGALYRARPINSAVDVYDAANPTAPPSSIKDTSTPTFNGPEGLAVSPSGKALYVGNFGSVSVVDTISNSVISSFSVPGASYLTGAVVSPDGKTLYLAAENGDAVDVVNLADTGADPTVITDPQDRFRDPSSLALSANGKTLYVGNFDTGQVDILSTTTHAISTVSDPGDVLANEVDAVALSPDGDTLYVCGRQDLVAVVDTATNTVVRTITDPAGTNFKQPTGLAVSANGATVYVENGTGGTISEIAVPAAPRGTASISTAARVGAKLAAKTAGWDSDAHLAYQWSANGAAIKGATGSTFTPKPTLVGKRLTVTVTDHEAGYTPVSVTSLTRTVAKGKLSSSRPTITGKARVGKMLTATPGAWKPQGTHFTYQWLAGGKKIAGAKHARFTLTNRQLGKKISVKVTGKQPGYAPSSRTSKKTAKVKG